MPYKVLCFPMKGRKKARYCYFAANLYVKKFACCDLRQIGTLFIQIRAQEKQMN